METKDYLLFIGPLLGVVVGGIITSSAKWLEIRHQRKTALRDLQLARLEALHELISDFVYSMGTTANKAMSLCSTAATDKQRRAEIVPLLQEFQRPSALLGAQILSHAPRLAGYSDSIVAHSTSAANGVFEFVDLHIEKPVLAEDRQRAYEVMRKSLLDLSTIALQIQIEIGSDIKAILEL